MKKVIALLLALAAILSLAACGKSETPAPTGAGNTAQAPAVPEDTTPITAWEVDNFPYPTFNQKLTWDAINAQPAKREDMTIQEMREACVSFMNFSKTAMYIPNDYLSFEKNNSGATDEMPKGMLYAGLPYIGGGGCGNVYRLMDYIDVDTGVLNMEYIKLRPNLFGNHCSSCTYWAWGRVISSVEHAFTADITHNNGYLRIGPYTYNDDLAFSSTYTSDMVVADNGMQTMYKSYAELHLADGLVNYHSGGGHVIMATSEPTIVYLSNGDIDPVNSYITISDQGQSWVEYTNEAGDAAQMKANVNKKMTFLDLYQGAYLPFTFAEFLGTKPMDKTEVSINLEGDTVDQIKLFSAKVTCNFGISDIYMSLYDASGREVYRLVTRAVNAGEKQLQFAKNATNSFAWGDLNTLSGEYTVKISAQLSTGERPELYSGKVTITQN